MVGERKQKILETIVGMLGRPEIERITTAILANKLEVSEAALYRHFAGKAQMFEGLIAFVESTIFNRVNKIVQEEKDGLKQAYHIALVLLMFAEKNPGLARILTGEALIYEQHSLQLRVNQFYERVHSTLKQSLRIASTQTEQSVQVEFCSHMLICYVIGCLHLFTKSGFKNKPTAHAHEQLSLILR